jgi:glycine cleavage system H protein
VRSAPPTDPGNYLSRIEFKSQRGITVANIPDDLRYTEEHEYVRDKGDGTVEIGITDYAQGELGDVVYVELPKVGTKLAKHDVFGTIEAVKAVSELFSPVAGEVIEINERLDQEPALVNGDPYGSGWMVRMRIDDKSALDGLMEASAYGAQIG